jgi:hypothetical protein
VIVSLHVASGAAGGALAGSPGRALVLGPLLHLVGDWIPHGDIPSRRFEIGSGLAALLLVGLRRGVLDPATIGAVAASAPDLEHVLHLPWIGGRKLFPSHRIRGWHHSGGLPAWAQLLLAGYVLGGLVGPRLRGAPEAKRKRAL